MRAPLRLALLAVAAGTLAACATAEDYLTSINPFRRQDEASPPSAPVQPVAETGSAHSIPLPPARPSEVTR